MRKIFFKFACFSESPNFNNGKFHNIFSFSFRIFDKDDDGLISVEELRNIMLRLGEKMTDKELDEMIAEANCDKDGHIDYEGTNFPEGFPYYSSDIVRF